MNSNPALRRWLSILGTGAILTAVLVAVAFQRSSGQAEEKKGPAAGKKDGRNWPLFGGSVQRNLVNLVEKGIATDWAVPAGAGKGKNIKWMVDLGSKAYGGPIVSGGKIFIGTNNDRPRNKDIKGDKGVIMCFRESDGGFLWQATHDKLGGGRAVDWPREGICSSPVVEGDRLWYTSNRCEVVCANVEGDGKGKAKFLWKLDMMGAPYGVVPHNLATCSPLIVGNTLFTITSNGVDKAHVRIPAPKAPSFLAVDKNTGKVKWSSNLPGRNIMHGQWSNPVYANVKGRPQIIFPGGDGFLYSFNPDNGSLLWKFDCNPKGSIYRLGPAGTRNDFVCTPVVWEDKLYIPVGQDPEHRKSVGHLWCIDITKTPKNKNKDLSPWSPPKGDEAFGNFDPKDPRNKDSALVWHYGGEDKTPGAARPYKFGRSLSTCAVHDGLCYACDFDGVFFCFDARTGEKLWEHDMEADTWGSPYWVDGHVYIGNENGEIVIFMHGRKKVLVRKIGMGRTAKVRATPVAVNGVLYVMAENPTRLYAIQVP